MFVHDSVMKYVDGNRLGHSYGFDTVSCRVHRTEEIQPVLDAVLNDMPATDAIVIHCGVNDIKSSDPQTGSKKLPNCTKNVVLTTLK